MEKTIEDLKLEADTLGIVYSPNIGAAKLQAKIEEFYDAESKTADITVEKVEEDNESDLSKDVKDANRKRNAATEARKVIAQQEKANAETVIVKITMVDKREASTATDAYFNNGDYGMRVPLDVFVEMPKILVERAEDAKALIHMQVGDTSVPKYTKKYVVEYKK